MGSFTTKVNIEEMIYLLVLNFENVRGYYGQSFNKAELEIGS